jgi:hypothetical protein
LTCKNRACLSLANSPAISPVADIGHRLPPGDLLTACTAAARESRWHAQHPLATIGWALRRSLEGAKASANLLRRQMRISSRDPWNSAAMNIGEAYANAADGVALSLRASWPFSRWRVPLEYSVGALTCASAAAVAFGLGPSRVLFTLVYVIVRSMLGLLVVLFRRDLSKTLSCWSCAMRMRCCAARSHACGTSRRTGRGWPRCLG